MECENNWIDHENTFHRFALVQTIAGIATSVKPGLVISLWQGINFTRQLLQKYSHLSFIPIHHMEAHALTVRLTHE